jgi:hypothetical protein
VSPDLSKVDAGENVFGMSDALQPVREENRSRKEMTRMPTSRSLFSSLFLSSTILWGAATVEADESTVKTPLDLPGYCHMQFPEMLPDTVGWDRPLLDENTGNVVDFYGLCAHDPTGGDEIRIQRRVMMRGLYGDSE